MIGRALWLAVLLTIAGLTTALQFDRQSERSPELAPLVPAPFRGYAQTRLAVTAIESKNAPAALAAAQELVRRRPVPAEHLTLLAAAQAQAGMTEQAGFSIQIGAQRGWRDPVAQEAVLRLALAAGDKAEAVRRYAALFRREATPDALLTAIGPQVFGAPGDVSRDTFALIITRAGRWQDRFLQRGLLVMPPEAFGEIVGLAIARGAQFNCAPLRTAIEGLRQRDAAAAERLAATAARLCS